MKIKHIAIATLAMLVLVLLWIVLDEEERGKRKDAIIAQLKRENHELKRAYFSLLEKLLSERPQTEPSVLRELKRVRDEIDELDTATHLEIDSAMRHVAANEYAKAVRDIAKILEVKLKEAVQEEDKPLKRQTLQHALEIARSQNVISAQDFENIVHLKAVRNQESHELAVHIEPRDAGLLMFAAIKVMYKVARRRVVNVH